jgi:hypothetical protein
MADFEFIGYMNEPDVHDGTILQVKHSGAEAHVLVKTYEGRLFAFDFEGVESINQIEPEGVILYSVSEMAAPKPFRSFVFCNWNEDQKNELEIVAQRVATREISNAAEF